jgi:hypothetical protein
MEYNHCRPHGKDEYAAAKDFCDGLEFECRLIRVIAAEISKGDTP